MDECHRAVSPAKTREIEEFFVHSLWYGFTGTPIFLENAKTVVGDLPRTTAQQYGERLHEYTVKEAIHNKAVLGFQVEYKSTFSEEQLDKYIMQQLADGNIDIDDMSRIDKEARLHKSIYEEENHMLEVIASIINKSRKKLGFQKSPEPTYNSILTTSSIAQAQRYYDLFKKVKAGETALEIDDETKRVLPDFPKVAITYSISENEESSIENQEKMKESLRDYNEEFGTNFTMESIRAYNGNVNERIVRKKDKYLARNEQLDLVIVVDRLLTGFDAPCLSTLFIDRQPMKPHDLIQAFSRTNRLFDKPKKYGQIVTFQTPYTFEQKVKEALVLYSNGGENEVLAPSWEEARFAFVMDIQELKDFVPTPQEVDGLNRSQLKKFVKAFQKLDKTFSAVQVYSDYDQEQLGNEFQIVMREIEEFNGKYVNALEELHTDSEGEELIDIDIEYELESVKTEDVNYEYIVLLIQAFVPSGDDEYELLGIDDEKTTEEVNKYIDKLSRSNPKLSRIMFTLWSSIRDNPEEYRDQNVSNVLEDMIQEEEMEVVQDFSDKWYVEEEELMYVVANYNPKKDRQNGENELKRSANYDLYRESAENPVSKLRYWKTVRTELKEVMSEDILPLQRK